MICDLNIPWPGTATPELQRTLTFLAELNYTTIALNNTITTPTPTHKNPIPTTFSFSLPPALTLLTRGTLLLPDPSLPTRLPLLASQYDLFALRPTTEKAFLAACTTLNAADFSLISLDLTQRFPFHFRPKPLMAAIKRGLRFELCYSAGVGGDKAVRAQVLSNVVGIVRATGGRGLVVSSGAGDVLGIRGVEDVKNLLVVWGVGGDRVGECLGGNAWGVVRNEAVRRNGFRGVVEIIEGGVVKQDDAKGKENGKRKITEGEDGATPKLSKTQAKKQRMAAKKAV